MFKDTGLANTLNTFDIGDKRANELVCEPIGFKYHQGEKAGTLGEGVSPTLTSDYHQPAVTEPVCMAPAFSKRPGQQIATTEGGVSYALTTGEPPRITSD